MAETKTNQPQAAKESRSTLARQAPERRSLRNWDPEYRSMGPFDFFERMSEEMERAFDRMWRDTGAPQRRWLPRFFGSSRERGLWSPRIESFQKGDQFIVRADLPGLRKDDVELELTDEALTIRGERREEHEEERDGYFRSEREYGQFYRTIPLPDGVIAESARASFRDGVLEVSMQAPPAEATRGRRLEIKEASETEPGR